jgi:hypothetical protein
LLWTPRRPVGQIVAVAVVFLVAASDILALVFVPLALARPLRPVPGPGPRRVRDRDGIALAAALLVGVGIQVLGLLTGASSRALEPDAVQAVTGYVLRAVPPALLGERWLGSDVGPRWIVLAGCAWLLVAGALVLSLRRITRPGWALAAVAFAHSVALYALPVFLSGTATMRYAAAPAMLLVTAFVALLQPGESRAPLYAFTVLLAVVWAANLRVDNARADGPRWSDEVDRATTQCREPGAGAENVQLLVSPRDAPTPWVVRLPCRELRD